MNLPFSFSFAIQTQIFSQIEKRLTAFPWSISPPRNSTVGLNVSNEIAASPTLNLLMGLVRRPAPSSIWAHAVRTRRPV